MNSSRDRKRANKSSKAAKDKGQEKNELRRKQYDENEEPAPKREGTKKSRTNDLNENPAAYDLHLKPMTSVVNLEEEELILQNLNDKEDYVNNQLDKVNRVLNEKHQYDVKLFSCIETVLSRNNTFS